MMMIWRKSNGANDADALRFRQFSVLPEGANHDARQGARLGIRQGRLVQSRAIRPEIFEAQSQRHRADARACRKCDHRIYVDLRVTRLHVSGPATYTRRSLSANGY